MAQCFLVIERTDDAATWSRALSAGKGFEIAGTASLVQLSDTPNRPKFAGRDIRAHAAIRTYEAEIGLAAAVIGNGALVHAHDLSGKRLWGDPVSGPTP